MSLAGTTLHCLVRTVQTTVAALIIYFCAKIIRKLFRAYRELFVMWTIASGRRWMPKIKSLRIQPYICRTSDLDDVSINECFQFHHQVFCPTDDISEDELRMLYHKVLLSYSHVMFYREKLDGSLRGLVLLGTEHKQTHTLVKTGMILTHKNYRGGPWLKIALICFVLQELILHPFTPLYLIGKVSSYKTYLIATSLQTYPRHDKETPESYKIIAEDFVKTLNVPISNYDRDTLVLKHGLSTLQGHVAEISERELNNPHIRFFHEHNSGWHKGDQLICVSTASWSDLWSQFIATFSKLKHKSSTTVTTNTHTVSRKTSAQLHRQLKRGMTYQDIEATLHSIQYYACHNDHDGKGGVANNSVNSEQRFVKRLYSHVEEEEFDIDMNDF